MNTYQCKNDMITKDERKQLLSETMNFKLWSDKVSFQVLEFDPLKQHFCLYKFSKDLDEKNYDEIRELKKSPLEGLFTKLINKTNSKLKFFIAAYVKFASGGGVRIHKDTDTVPGRASSITWALSPLKDFSPIRFYNEDKTFNEDVYYKEKPLLVNTNNYHTVDNKSEQPRYSFQLCFYDPIEKLVELDQKGELFI